MKDLGRTETIVFRMTPALKKRIEWLAKAQNISMNEWLHRKIESKAVLDEIVKEIRCLKS